MADGTTAPMQPQLDVADLALIRYFKAQAVQRSATARLKRIERATLTRELQWRLALNKALGNSTESPRCAVLRSLIKAVGA